MILSLVLISQCGILHAQATKAEEIYSFTRVINSYKWYVTQHELWAKEVKKDKKDEEAWTNYYAATRYAGRRAETEEIRLEWVEKEEDVLAQVAKNIPNTFAYYYIMSWAKPVYAAQNPEERKEFIDNVLKAHQIQPENSEVYPELMNIYEVYAYNPTQLEEISKLWKKSAHFTPATFLLAHNMLNGAQKDAIILTAGDNDTYPLWVAQHADNVRKDLTVLNVYLAQIESYRKRIFKKLNIPELVGENKSFEEIIQHIIEHKGQKTLYFTSRSLFNDQEDLLEQVYNVGLLYQYSEEELDNVSILVHNFEEVFYTDLLMHNYYTSEWEDLDLRMNNMYVPGLVHLYKYYQLINKTEKAEETFKVIQRLAQHFDYYESVKKQLGIE
ncbi:hypothetical protein SAMN05216474_2747 [Lishizhenia tianjinensis]|uniref:Uncharacterized protein n=2 Tax=Lishizhenia tianjinensis TaxID=477690 RepID=A0A1I7BEJ4_9FLAO|nr:hypothetical protein SAMN05216474_2747 [Lishizhenia tianjinensis]